jgi:hypothetical protein
MGAESCSVTRLGLDVSGCNLLKSTLELPEKGIRSMLLLDQENGAPF